MTGTGNVVAALVSRRFIYDIDFSSAVARRYNDIFPAKRTAINSPGLGAIYIYIYIDDDVTAYAQLPVQILLRYK